MKQKSEINKTSSAQGGKTRVCPYCENHNPVSEDQCHYYGHLESGEITPKAQSEDLRIYIVLLLVGIVLLIWPGTGDHVVYMCDFDFYEVSDCFFSNVWNIPIGISLVTVCLINIACGVVSNARDNKATKVVHRPVHRGSHGQTKVASR